MTNAGFNYFISSLLTGITTFVLAIFVLTKNPKSKLYRAFFFYTISISAWSFPYAFMANAPTKQIGTILGHVFNFGVGFICVCFVHFVLILTEMEEKKRQKIIRPLYIIAVIFTILVPTRLMVAGVKPKFGLNYFINPGPVYYLYVVFWLSCIIFGMLKLFTEYRMSTGARRNQLKYLFFGSLIGYMGGPANFLLVFDIKYPLYPFGTYAVPFYAIITAYAIVKYRLMDVRVAITRTGIFVAVYSLVLGLPFAVAVWYKNWLIEVLGAGWWMLPLGLMAALATVGPFIYIYLDRKAEGKLLREQKRYQQTLKQASVGMTRIRNLRKLLDLITHIVTKTVRISYAAIYLYNHDTDEYILQVSRDKGRIPIPKITSDNPLVSWIMVKREPLIYEEIKRQMEDTGNEAFKLLEENMRILTATVVIPSFLEDRFMGFFVLGEKVSGQIYTPDDLNVFQILASQAALAIENAQFYDEAKEMQEQIAQAEKMATIGTMADGLSHQINNRFHALSLIAGDTIDTIKLTDTSKCTPEVREMIDSINHALERIQSNVLQGGEVVRGMLKYSRKGDAGFEAIDLDKVIDNTLEMVQFKVKLSEVDIIRDYNNIPKIKANMTQLEEVFFNFIDNAYDATVERRTLLKEDGYRGKITISAKPKESALEITVADNGMGIKDEENKKIFTPFFTTKTSSRKGTGLGLYVIRRIITDSHKGKVSFESQYKVGTRFILELPLAK